METKNLDGETNLKIKYSVKEIAKHCTTEREVLSLKGNITCEKPNDRIYHFEGVFEFDSLMEHAKIPIRSENLLLRGSSLKNTEFIYGLVVFTGHDTKIMKNSIGSRIKTSYVEKLLNL